MCPSVEEGESAPTSSLPSLPSSVECLHQVFEHHVDLSPDSLALIDRTNEFSYIEVDQIANQLSHYLRSEGLGRGDIVGLFCRRSIEAVISILGILKAGATYLPLEELWPDDRIQSILAETNTRFLITDQHLESRARDLGTDKTLVHDASSVMDLLQDYSTDRLPPCDRSARAEDLSYIIYTSGSTGQPKGIMTEHRNVVAFARAFRKTCEMRATDRVYQGFSLTFDGSVEEMWMAYSAGSSLVIGPPELARLGEETGQYLKEKKVTFFSTVPSFLAMIPEDLPDLRLVIVSGEACPPSLIERWARPGVKMLNVYGPTETTVNATSWECRPGVPVTIGKPLDSYRLYILDERMQEVVKGEVGELFIGGPGVARGYLNRPELTDEVFLKNPFTLAKSDFQSQESRFYRTGDLVQELESGELAFHGRADGQVKVRGYRIELSEIESVLQQPNSVEAGVVTVSEHQGAQELAAYISVKPEVDEASLRTELFGVLKKQLPSYMVPSYLDILPELPRLTSGKVDRKSLPAPRNRLIEIFREIIPPETQVEKTVADAWSTSLQISPISVEDDFFLDLGGDSLKAVETAVLLRESLNPQIGARDVYRYSKVRDFAREFSKSAKETIGSDQKSSERETQEQVFAQQNPWTRRLGIAIQCLTLAFVYGFPTAIAMGLTWLCLGVLNNQVAISTAITAITVVFLGGVPLMLSLSIIVKWLVIGRFKPGAYPLYSSYYLRWWIVMRFYRMSGAGFLSGTVLMNLYLRLMGAHIGKACVIHTGHFAAFDLISIGDGTCIGSESQLLGYSVEAGKLVLGKISLGRQCYVGIQSCINHDTEMGDRSLLDDLSLLPVGTIVGDGEMLQGSPAQAGQVTVPEINGESIPERRNILMGILSVFAIYGLQLFMVIASLPSLYLLATAYSLSSYLLWGIVFMVSIPLFELVFWALMILVKFCVLHRSQPGIYRVDSIYFLRKWFVDALLGFSRLFTLPVYTTIYFPPLLRCLGAKIGKRAELSVIVQMSPDLTEMGEESFFADGSIVGSMKIYRGHFELARNRIGSRSFVGNSAVLPVGASMGSGCLLGVLSSPPRNGDVPDGSEWLGAPSFSLPNRHPVEGFSDEQTYRPSPELIFARLLVDALRIGVSGAIEILGVVMIVGFAIWSYSSLGWVSALILTPLVGFLTACSMALSVVGIKRLLFETYRPVQRPLWSSYVWFNEVVNGAHESVAAPTLSPLLGTPFFSIYLRLMGCKIGKNCFFDTTLLGEFDLVDIGNHVSINYDVVLQNHLFEDRIFKSSHLVIDDNCSIGSMSVVLYDTHLQRGTSVASLSLVMKGESLHENSDWIGIPIRRYSSEIPSDKS